MLKSKVKLSTLCVISYSLIFLLVLHGINPNFYPQSINEFDLDMYSDSIAGSNLITQIIWIGIFLFSVYYLSKQTVNKAIFFEPLVLLYYLIFVISLLSLFQSSEVFLGVKRFALFFISSVTIFLLAICSVRAFNPLDYLKHIIIYIVALDFISIFWLGIDSDGFFRGVHSMKNTAGIIYSYFTIYLISRYRLYFRRSDLILLCIVSFFLLISQSKTAIFTVLIFLLFYSNRKMIITALILLVTCVPLLVVMYYLDLIELPMDFLTGRGQIWFFLKYYINEHFYSGAGFGSFWAIGDASQNVNYGEGYIKAINTAHNGYIDLIITGGVFYLLLIILFFLTCIKFLYDNYTSEYNMFVTYSFFGLFVSNVTESTFLYAQLSPWVFFIVCLSIVLSVKYNN